MDEKAMKVAKAAAVGKTGASLTVGASSGLSLVRMSTRASVAPWPIELEPAPSTLNSAAFVRKHDARWTGVKLPGCKKKPGSWEAHAL